MDWQGGSGMTYTNQHTKASPSKWVGGYIVGYSYSENLIFGTLDPLWSDNEVPMTNSMFEAVKVVALALDKMTK